MATRQEEDFPVGHPARFDYDASSPEAKEWARLNIHPKGERDFPVGHPKAVDTPGNKNHVEIIAGVDPDKPHLEPFTGRTPEQAKAARELYESRKETAKESPALQPIMAIEPPKQVNVQRAMRIADGSGFMIFCPACKCGHKFDSRWTFNGSLELPTFVPSYKQEEGTPPVTCHCYVTNGRIQFLSDSTHALSGQSYDLPPVGQMEETINASRA